MEIVRPNSYTILYYCDCGKLLASEDTSTNCYDVLTEISHLYDAELCDDCFLEKYVPCKYCGEYTPIENTIKLMDDTYICEVCIEDIHEI